MPRVAAALEKVVDVEYNFKEQFEIFANEKAEGGLMGELNRPDRGYKNGGKVARGCGAIMSNRRKKTKMM